MGTGPAVPFTWVYTASAILISWNYTTWEDTPYDYYLGLIPAPPSLPPYLEDYLPADSTVDTACISWTPPNGFHHRRPGAYQVVHTCLGYRTTGTPLPTVTPEPLHLRFSGILPGTDTTTVRRYRARLPAWALPPATCRGHRLPYLRFCCACLLLGTCLRTAASGWVDAFILPPPHRSPFYLPTASTWAGSFSFISPWNIDSWNAWLPGCLPFLGLGSGRTSHSVSGHFFLCLGYRSMPTLLPFIPAHLQCLLLFLLFVSGAGVHLPPGTGNKAISTFSVRWWDTGRGGCLFWEIPFSFWALRTTCCDTSVDTGDTDGWRTILPTCRFLLPAFPSVEQMPTSCKVPELPFLEHRSACRRCIPVHPVGGCLCCATADSAVSYRAARFLPAVPFVRALPLPGCKLFCQVEHLPGSGTCFSLQVYLDTFCCLR